MNRNWEELEKIAQDRIWIENTGEPPMLLHEG